MTQEHHRYHTCANRDSNAARRRERFLRELRDLHTQDFTSDEWTAILLSILNKQTGFSAPQLPTE